MKRNSIWLILGGVGVCVITLAVWVIIPVAMTPFDVFVESQESADETGTCIISTALCCATPVMAIGGVLMLAEGARRLLARNRE